MSSLSRDPGHHLGPAPEAQQLRGIAPQEGELERARAPQQGEQLTGAALSVGEDDASQVPGRGDLEGRTAQVHVADGGEHVPERIGRQTLTVNLAPPPPGARGRAGRPGPAPAAPPSSTAPPPASHAAAGANTSRPWKVAETGPGTTRGAARRGARPPSREGGKRAWSG